MPLTFSETEPDEALANLRNEILFVKVVVAQYRMDFDVPINTYDFKDQKKFRNFFDKFATYANPKWREMTGHDWNLSKFPFRESSIIIKGLFRILKTGGAYTSAEGEPYNEDDALRIEEKLRKGFQKDSQELLIFCYVKEDTLGEDVSSGFGVPNEMFELRKEISSFYESVAWDDLIVIINPKYNMLYVIAYTDTD